MYTTFELLREFSSSTTAHSTRASYLSLILAKEVGITDCQELKIIQYGALLHDIGKTFISDRILKKTSKLTLEEINEIQKHPQIGYNIVSTVPLLKEIANIILSHHEHYDGSGYPSCLAGNSIHFGARILSVIDAYDAITTDRAYRKAQTKENAVAEINRCSGTQFDPHIISAFNKCYFKF